MYHQNAPSRISRPRVARTISESGRREDNAMPFQPAPSIALVTCEGLVDAQQTINDLAFFSSGAITQTTLQNLVNNVATWFTDNLAPLLSDDWQALRVRGADLTTATGVIAEAAAVAAGGVGGEANPNNVAACVSFRTAQRGRSGRGRNFVPGIPGAAVTLNTIDSALISNLIAAYTVLIGVGTFTPGWQWVVLSRQTGGVLRANGIGIPITSVTMVGNSVRSMRSREIGHGS